MYNKKDLTERDICTKFITPTLEHSGRDKYFNGKLNIRILKKHGEDVTEVDAWEKLVLASHLMKMWDGRSK